MIWDIIANLYYKNYATDLRYLSKVKNYTHTENAQRAGSPMLFFAIFDCDAGY